MLTKNDYHPFYQGYVDLVPSHEIVSELNDSMNKLMEIYTGINESWGDYRYAENKWTVKEVLQHIIDTERVFAYRSMCIARKDPTNLPGFDENTYAANVDCSDRLLSEVLEEFVINRKSIILLFKSFKPETMVLSGTANESSITVGAMGIIVSGHSTHHLNVLQERYQAALKA